jgi:acyl carrier protein
MNRIQWIPRRRALLVLAGVAAAVSRMSTICVADASPQTVVAENSRIPGAVLRIIVEQLSIPEARVTWDARFIEDLGCDSLDTVELQMALEEVFKIEIPDEVAEKLLRVGDLVEYLRKRDVLK